MKVTERINSFNPNILKMIFLSLCVLLIVSIVTMFFVRNSYINKDKANKRDNKLIISNKKRIIFKMPDPNELILKPFLIPVEGQKGNHLYTLKISIKVPNIKTRELINHETYYIRALIYDGIKRKIQDSGEIPPVQEIKKVILERINEFLDNDRFINIKILDLKTI